MDTPIAPQLFPPCGFKPSRLGNPVIGTGFNQANKIHAQTLFCVDFGMLLSCEKKRGVSSVMSLLRLCSLALGMSLNWFVFQFFSCLN
jgi:hypothetical protein